MNKAQLIEALIEKHHQRRESVQISKADMTAIVDGLTGIVYEQLAKGEEVALPGIGKLVVSRLAERTGRNPQTGEPIQLPAGKTPRFKPSKVLKGWVNNA